MYLALVMTFGMMSAVVAQLPPVVDDIISYNIQNYKSGTCIYGQYNVDLDVKTCGHSGDCLVRRKIANYQNYGLGRFQFTFGMGNYGKYCLQAGHGNGAATNSEGVIATECDVNKSAQIWDQYATTVSPWGTVSYQFRDQASGKCLTKTPENNLVVMYTCDPDADHQWWYLIEYLI